MNASGLFFLAWSRLWRACHLSHEIRLRLAHAGIRAAVVSDSGLVATSLKNEGGQGTPGS